MLNKPQAHEDNYKKLGDGKKKKFNAITNGLLYLVVALWIPQSLSHFCHWKPSLAL